VSCSIVFTLEGNCSDKWEELAVKDHMTLLLCNYILLCKL